MIRILLFVFLGMLVFGLISGILAFSVLYKFLSKLLGRVQDTYNKDSRDIIDVIPEMTASDHSLSERRELASKSVEIALREVSFAKVTVVPSLLDEIEGLSPVIRGYQRHETRRGELIFIQNLFKDVHNMVASRRQFAFTENICKQVLSGVKLSLLKNNSSDNLTIGMVYTGQFIKEYVYDLSIVIDSLNTINDRELAKQLEILVENMEKVHWIEVTNPKYITKHSIFLAEATDIVTKKVHLINRAVSLGVQSKEYKDLQNQTLTTVVGINKALGNIFNEIMTPELLHANAEMEVIHSELKIKGLI